MSDHDKKDAAAVDQMLARAGLTITDEERAYYIRAYPILNESLTHLRIPEARNADPATIYPADNRR